MFEVGLTYALVNPEHTDSTIFKPDENPKIKTDPFVQDTDSDELFDGFKDIDGDGVYDGGDELGEDNNCNGMIEGDTDKDGIIDLKSTDGDDAGNGKNSAEVWEETNPYNDDSDEDGLLDGYDILEEGTNLIKEVNGILKRGELSRHFLDPDKEREQVLASYLKNDAQVKPTDPVNPDSDGDLSLDGSGEFVIHFTGAEYRCRWQKDSEEPFVIPAQRYYTDPTRSDCDRDGLLDGVETTGWEVIITNGKTLKIEPSLTRHVNSDPWTIDTDGDNSTFYSTIRKFYTSDFEEWMYRSDPTNIDTDGDYIRDWNETEVSINQIEGEDPEMGEIEGKIGIEWHEECGIPVWPEHFTLELKIPVKDNAGLDKLEIWVAGRKMNDIMLDGIKEKKVKTTFKADAFKAIVNGYDVEAKVHDVNGNTKEGETHVDGALEGLVKLLLAFIILAIMLLLAFLGAWVIPIIMAACAITIGISIGVVLANSNSWAKNAGEELGKAYDDYMNGKSLNSRSLTSTIVGGVMGAAIITLSVAITILFSCLKPYTSIGSWVMSGAIMLGATAVCSAFGLGASEQNEENYKRNKLNSDILKSVSLDTMNSNIGKSKEINPKEIELFVEIMVILIGSILAIGAYSRNVAAAGAFTCVAFSALALLIVNTGGDDNPNLAKIGYGISTAMAIGGTLLAGFGLKSEARNIAIVGLIIGICMSIYSSNKLYENW